MSAPYEGSGAVYVYYGQERDSDGSIADPQYAQVPITLRNIYTIVVTLLDYSV